MDLNNFIVMNEEKDALTSDHFSILLTRVISSMTLCIYFLFLFPLPSLQTSHFPRQLANNHHYFNKKIANERIFTHVHTFRDGFDTAKDIGQKKLDASFPSGGGLEHFLPLQLV